MIPFSPPRIDQKIIDAVVETLRSGWLTTGPRVRKFEEELIAFCGADAALCTSHATAGLELVLRWFGIGKGDEVIVPAYTYCATANVIVHCGAIPVMVDSGKDFNISMDCVKKAITTRTKAIIPVDIAGFPCDYDTLNQIVNSPAIKNKFHPKSGEQKKLARILLLSDSAHSLGAWYKGKRTGSLADFSVFSFHAVKNLSTAEGGAILFNLPAPFDNQQVYRLMRIKSLHGQTLDAIEKFKGLSWKYDVVEAGYKCNMTDIQASIGLVELKRYDKDTLPRRRKIFELYSTIFSPYSWVELPSFDNDSSVSSYHLYMLRIKDISEERRNAIIKSILAKEVCVNVHFQPLPLLTAYKNLGYKASDYPVAMDNYRRVISLPVYYDLKENEVRRVAKTVISSVEESTIP